MTNVLLCATDAGGARSLAPLLPVLIQRGLSPTLVTTRACRDLFLKMFDPACEMVLTDDLAYQEREQFIMKLQPAVIICGTTRFASPDRHFIGLGRMSGVRTIAVLDEWYNYRLRFEDLETEELTNLPDAIAVQDDQAKAEAVAEGAPVEVCHVTGSPALADLLRRAQGLAKSPPPEPECLFGVENRPVITFLSETHAADYGTAPDSPGALGPFIGYTEITVREAILKMLGRLKQPVAFIEKLHPAAEDEDKAQPAPQNVDWRTVRKTDLWALLWHSDIVIGMRSMALLEANVLGCEVASFQPGLIGGERCTAVRLGLIPKMDRLDDLEAWCQNLATTLHTPRNRMIRQYPFAAPDAAERVVDLALNGRVF